jgi:glutamate synthase domain-containing protein 3
MVTIDCAGKSIREVNREMKNLAGTEPEIKIVNPDGRHLLGVGLIGTNRITIEGSVGYFCAGLTDGPRIEITNKAGWCLAENMMAGEITVHKHASSGACSALSGATVVIRGNAGSRVGQVMKQGLAIIQGNAGYMVGFMMMGGKIIIIGDVGDNLGEGLIRGEIFVGGNIQHLSQDAREVDLETADKEELGNLLHRYRIRPPQTFKKIIAAQKKHG